MELLAYAGVGANYANRFEDAIGLYEESIRCSREADLVPVPIALASLGIAALETNHPADAVAHCEAGVEAARAADDLFWELFTMGNLALAYTLGGDYERGQAVSDELLNRTRRLGNQSLTGTALMAAGVSRVLDEPEVAIELLEESARLLPTSSNVGQTCFFRDLVAPARTGRQCGRNAALRPPAHEGDRQRLLRRHCDRDYGFGARTGVAACRSRAPRCALTVPGSIRAWRGRRGTSTPRSAHARVSSRRWIRKSSKLRLHAAPS